MTCDEIIAARKRLWENNQDVDLDIEFIMAAADKIIENSKTGAAIRAELRRFPEKLIGMCFTIVDKNSNTLPFFLNESQQLLIDIINKGIDEYREGKRNHLNYLLLKGRQAGMTSFITAYQLAKAITTRNFSGVTIADNGDNTTNVFVDKAKFTYSMLPDVLKPLEKYSTKREMYFEKLNSKWRCLNASGKEIGRSKTINFWHGSEVAFFPSFKNVMGALGQALTKDSIKILETTANGFNEYRDLWTKAKSGENNWQPLFFEWWLTSEYRLNFESAAKEKEFKEFVNGQALEISKTLFWLLDFHNLQWEQLYWYYSKYKELGELVKQEYPNSDSEAFLASGNPIFDNAKILKRIEHLEMLYKTVKPIKGRFTYTYSNQMIIDSSIRFVPDDNGNITIYEDVQPYMPYVIGGDTAEGGEDYCIGQVINNQSGRQAAVFRGRMDTDLYAKQMYCLGKYFNEALLSIEMNFDLHPVKELDRLEYPKQYLRETMDTTTGAIQYKHGFNTNRATRPIIIGNLVEIVRDSTHLINDIDTLKEMLTFIKTDEGRAEAAEGEHDDLVMALAISYYSRNQQDFVPEVKEKKKQPLHWALRTDEEDKGGFMEW